MAWTVKAAAADVLGESEGVRHVCTMGPQMPLLLADRRRGDAEVSAAAVLPNPNLVIEHHRTLRGTDEQETVIGASVPIGIGGRRFILKDVAGARREQALAQADATLFDLALAFREAYVAAAIDAARLEVLIRQQALIDGLGSVMQRLSRGGEAAGYDLSRQEVQARLHRGLLASRRGRAQASVLLLETWIGRQVALSDLPLEALAGGSRTSVVLAVDSLARHPRAIALQAESRASVLEVRASRRRWVPDLEVFAGYRSTTNGSQSGEGVSLGLTLPLTLFDHGQGEAALAEVRKGITDATLRGFEREKLVRLRSEGARLRTLEASVPDMERAIEQAKVVHVQATKLYLAGEGTLADLLDAFRSAEAAELQRIDLGEEIALARLSIMRSAGTSFDPALDRLCQIRAAGGR